MDLVRVTDRLAVAEQPKPENFADFFKAGFKTVVNARPEGETEDQPGSDAEAKAAADAGLGYSNVPVTTDSITEADVRKFQSALTQSDGPVVAHCKTGARALGLYALGEVLDGRMKPEDVGLFGTRHGFDLGFVDTWLNRHGVKPAAGHPIVKGFYEKRTGSIQYVVTDPETKKCAIIDPVLDFDDKSGAVATIEADKILDYIAKEGFTVEWILDTHPHADHFSAAHYLHEKTGAPTGIGEHVIDVQKLWKGIYNWPDLPADGSQWDHLFKDGETFKVGNIPAKVMFSPGHTLASITYVIGDAAFVHDTIFMPDSGTARADFPGGSAKVLWKSIQDILALPDETRVFTGHDYEPGGRNALWESTVGEQKQKNPHLHNMTEEEFVKVREARDRSLPMPNKILHALQINIRGGRLPEPEDNGQRYLKFPLNALEGAAWD
ncbi:bifunctional sulfur transferase/dioxygenase Blh [Methyloligella sp. 2.7D]|uniref:bifunctional sulfur transferase/dioxygenase Blh n=1 Tax=unclassified Methyloligella TaxID=2625955 RepID=UPI00157D3885|nr:bifunctional sulfur transferase/dioxygenase Blh [Methyloligella sp. GL2]QKP76127.1 MBL fold metallo-hydrolase [Methyloligella sp. GL2]